MGRLIQIPKTSTSQKKSPNHFASSVVHFPENKNQIHLSAASNSLKSINDALEEQLMAAKLFENRTKDLKVAIQRLDETCQNYDTIVTRLSVDRLRQKAIRLQQIMDIKRQ